MESVPFPTDVQVSLRRPRDDALSHDTHGRAVTSDLPLDEHEALHECLVVGRGDLAV